jgi:hypothetical protein
VRRSNYDIELKSIDENNSDDNEVMQLLENYEICKLDINRIYRYIEKYIKENAAGTVDKEIDDECDELEE